MSANHGNTPAAWTGVAIVLVGFVIGGIGLLIELDDWCSGSGSRARPLGARRGHGDGQDGPRRGRPGRPVTR